MNKRSFLWLFLGFILWGASAPLSAQSPAEAPQEAQPKELFWAERNADQTYVYLLYNHEIKLNDDWSYDELLNYRVKIQKEGANSLGEQKLYYDKSREEVTDIQAYVIAPDGKKYPYTKIQDLPVYQGSPMYSDFRVKVITLPQVGPGSVIDVYARGKTFSKGIKDQFWEKVSYPYIPTKIATSTYVFPLNKNIVFQQYKDDTKPTLEKTETIAKYTFNFSETDDLQDRESYLPPYEEIHGFANFSSIGDWKVIADWYRDLVKKNTTEDPAIKTKVEELIKDKKTQKEKAQAIIEFIQDNFRYVAMNFGEHTLEPHPTIDIFNNRYGDCKDWTLLSRQMLSLAGVKSNVCLFNDEYGGDPQHGLPQLSAFNHVILEIEVDGKKYFVDPQTKGYDFDEHPVSYDGARVLVIEDETFRFDQLPALGENLNALLTEGNITVDNEGTAVYDMKVTFGSEYSQGFRYMWKQSTEKDRQKFFEALEYKLSRGGEMISRRFEGLEERYGHVIGYFKYKTPNAYPLVNDMIILKEDSDDRIQEFAEKERRYPIFMPNNSLQKTVMTYQIPQGFRIDYVPQDYDIDTEFMEFAQKYTKSTDTVTIDNIYRQRRCTFPPEKYPQVQNFLKEYYKHRNKYIVLKSDPAQAVP